MGCMAKREADDEGKDILGRQTPVKPSPVFALRMLRQLTYSASGSKVKSNGTSRSHWSLSPFKLNDATCSELRRQV